MVNAIIEWRTTHENTHISLALVKRSCDTKCLSRAWPGIMLRLCRRLPHGLLLGFSQDWHPFLYMYTTRVIVISLIKEGYMLIYLHKWMRDLLVYGLKWSLKVFMAAVNHLLAWKEDDTPMLFSCSLSDGNIGGISCVAEGRRGLSLCWWW